RVDAPQRVRLHRQPGLHIAGPAAGHVGQPAVPADRDEPAGQPAIVDVAGEVPVDPRQPRRVQADFGRVHFLLEPAHRTTFLPPLLWAGFAPGPAVAAPGRD